MLLLLLAVTVTLTDCYSRPLSSSSSSSSGHLTKQHIDSSKHNAARRFVLQAVKTEKASKTEQESGLSAERIKKDIARTLAWVGAAGIFATGLTFTMGPSAGIEFVSGYALEQCLSVDNLFVFLVLFDYFKVSTERQDKVLSYGIWGAVVLRGIFIAAGSVALAEFHQILLAFAAVLFFSSYKILFKGEGEDEDEDLSQNPVVRFASAYFRTSDQFDGDRFFTQVQVPVDAAGKELQAPVAKAAAAPAKKSSFFGRSKPVPAAPAGPTKLVQLATPLFLCLVCIELSDVVFAFDSVPAIFGITENPLIVYSSNIFAIAGLRSLYGVLSSAVAELEYLEKAVGVILAVVASKMTAETFGVEILTPLQSLLVILTILGGGVGLSLQQNSQAAKEEAA